MHQLDNQYFIFLDRQQQLKISRSLLFLCQDMKGNSGLRD
jgi:hypothetical protein